MNYVVIISLGEIRAAYGPFNSKQAAQQWILTAREKHIIGTAMDAVVSCIYPIDNL